MRVLNFFCALERVPGEAGNRTAKAVHVAPISDVLFGFLHLSAHRKSSRKAEKTDLKSARSFCVLGH